MSDLVYFAIGTYDLVRNNDGTYYRDDNYNMLAIKPLENLNDLQNNDEPLIGVNYVADMINVDPINKSAILVISQKNTTGSVEVARTTLFFDGEPQTIAIPGNGKNIVVTCGISNFPLDLDGPTQDQLTTTINKISRLTGIQINPISSVTKGSEPGGEN